MTQDERWLEKYNEVKAFYLYFDHDGVSDHAQIEIPNCVSAVYFGLKCPDDERQFVMKLLEGKSGQIDIRSW